VREKSSPMDLSGRNRGRGAWVFWETCFASIGDAPLGSLGDSALSRGVIPSANES
jgi:hypothetical protein